MTQMHRSAFLIITFSLLLLTFLSFNAIASSISIDKIATVSTVIDGSSFTVNSGETIKLAGIDTPQSGQQGYSEAKNYLSNMVQSKTVYLNIDNKAVTDQYGRQISVAYLNYNSTHYENVNMAMIVNNYAVPISVNNSEFNPSSWTWFVPKDTPSPTPTFAFTPTASPSVAPYSSPPTPILSLSVPEFLVLVSLIIISIAVASVILLKLHKKKS